MSIVLREAFKKKMTKHMEFSICWLTPPPYQHMENSFVIFLLSKKLTKTFTFPQKKV